MIVGAGPIGCEMGQAFRRLGSDVTVIDRADRVLGRDDADHARVLQRALEGEGVRFVLGADVERVEGDNGRVAVHVTAGGERQRVEGDALLIATGRKPNVEGLGLDEAGIAYTKKGITVDDRCRTSLEHVWAAGDCTGEYQLTHMSEHMAKQAVTNAVLRIPAKIDRDGITWTTFTTPEVAQVGKTQQELQEAGRDFVTYRFPYTKVDRAVTEHAETGNIKVHATRWRGRILGASVVGERAGELISVYAVAMKAGVSVREISDTIFPYPTYGLGARRAADQYYVQKQFPLAVRAVKARVWVPRPDAAPARPRPPWSEQRFVRQWTVRQWTGRSGFGSSPPPGQEGLGVVERPERRPRPAGGGAPPADRATPRPERRPDPASGTPPPADRAAPAAGHDARPVYPLPLRRLPLPRAGLLSSLSARKTTRVIPAKAGIHTVLVVAPPPHGFPRARE